MNIADHLHAGFVPCLWSGLAIRKSSGSVSLEHDCVDDLRKEKEKLNRLMDYRRKHSKN